MHALTPPGGPIGQGPRMGQRPVRGAVYGPVAANRPVRRDPAPSRLAYRLNRLWLKPMVRKLVRVGVPALVIALVAGLTLADADRRAAMNAGLDSMVRSVQQRPEFQVELMKIDGASAVLAEGIRDMLPVALPASSFDLNIQQLRHDVAALDAVASVDMRIRAGVLEVAVTERQPAMLWRHATGIEILDETGHRVATVTGREVRGDLPVIAGEGADKAAAEALVLMDAVGPILPRLRGLERMGERRWDVVLDRDQRILLPEAEPRLALERALAMDKAEDILSRDVVAMDMRDARRPTLRMGGDAMRDMLRQRGIVEDEPVAKGEAAAAKGGKPAAGKKKKG